MHGRSSSTPSTRASSPSRHAPEAVSGPMWARVVGLSWAFLRAGAHNVIGALWEVSDDSTPRMMDALYQGLEDGMSPSAALRQAKLTLLHSQGSFRRPFYWASFQI